MTTQTLTPKEIKGLKLVAENQIEDNFSELIKLTTNELKGIIGSLIKKELIYDCYEDEKSSMFCLTTKGFEFCKKLNIDTSHITIY